MNSAKLQSYLRSYVIRYNNPAFIEGDPISVPHRFQSLQDREITGFWTAMLSWGQRKTIINKAIELFELMDNAPYDFIVNHEEKDRLRFAEFKHRTFQYTDTLYFLEFLQQYYRRHDSLEEAFVRHIRREDPQIKDALTGFHTSFFSLESAPQRTRKHVATPVRGSTCKRLNMFLRWMVRSDSAGVDFGMWKKIHPAWLMIPLDVHVERTARQLGMLTVKSRNWSTVEEITRFCREIFPLDPAVCDYALFGLSIQKNLGQPCEGLP